MDGLAPAPVRFTPPISALRVLVSQTPTLGVARYPESADPTERAIADHVHLCVHEDTPDVGALRRADLILAYAAGTGRAAADWLEQAAQEYLHASMITACTGPGRAIARLRGGRVFTLRCTDHRCDPAPLASALLAHLDLRAPISDQAFELKVDTGSATHTVRVTPWAAPRIIPVGRSPHPET
jgi:hypothetical protein